MKVAVIGGGVSGMSAAYRLREAGATPTIFEASGRAGGMLRTERTDGFVIERGPDSIITTKPAAARLAEELGLSPRIVRTNTDARGAYVVCRGELVRIPAGFQLLAPSNLESLEASGILSTEGMARVREEPGVACRTTIEDESLGSFVRRRFGDEVLKRIAQPMAGGIYGTDPEHLSLRATLPRFLDMELEGSLIEGLARRAKAGAAQAAGARYGLFISFDAGIGLLPETLAASLEGCIRLNAPVASIEKFGAGFHVDGEAFDAVIVATTAHKAAPMLPAECAEARASLESIPFGSGAIVTFAFERDEVPHSLDAAGFVVPAIEGLTLMASTWSSVKWPGRAPPGKVLLRAFMGGYHLPEVPTWDDARLVQAARDDFKTLMGIEAKPQLTRVDRWVEMMPRYFVGHARRMDSLDGLIREHEGLELAGNAYRGVGIPDSIASGEAAAVRILAR